MLTACGTSIGVGTIEREAVPGPTLIQKVLQQASSKSLPDVLMLDNPDIQQIADTGALAPLGDYGITADGYAPARSPRPPARRQALRPAARRQHDRDLLPQGRAGEGRRQAADHLGRAADRAKKLTVGQAVRLRLQRHRRLRGRLAVPAADVEQRRRRDRPQVPAGRAGPAAVEGPGRRRLGVQERRQLEAVRRERPVHRRQRGHDAQRPVAGARAGQGEGRLRRRPVPGRPGGPDLGRPARRRGVDRPRDRRRRRGWPRPPSW